MSFTGKQQLIAFLGVLGVLGIIGALPLIVAGIYGQSLPDALIANSDKTVAGLIGVLGTLAGLLFRRNANEDAIDAQRSDNTRAVIDMASAALTTSTGPTGEPSDPVNVTEAPKPKGGK